MLRNSIQETASRILRSKRGLLLLLAVPGPFWLSAASAQNAPQSAADGCVISGRVANRTTSGAIRGARLELADVSDAVEGLTSSSYILFGNKPKSSNHGLTALSGDDGTFCFRAVQPGQYVLNASKAGFVDSSYGVKSYLQTGSTLAVSSTAVPVIGPATLHGRVLFESVPDSVSVSMPTISLNPADAILGPEYKVRVDSSGGITAPAIRPGKYFLNVVAPSGAFVKSIRNGSTELSSREVDLTSGGIADLSVLVSYSSAVLTVNVTKATDASSAAASPPQVVLVAVPPRIDGSGIYVRAIDSSGQFTFSDVAPAKYRVVALPEVDSQLFNDPTVLLNVADAGTEVVLQEKENRSVQLSPLSSETADRLLGQTNTVQ